MDKSYDLILQSIKYIWKYTEGCPFYGQLLVILEVRQSTLFYKDPKNYFVPLKYEFHLILKYLGLDTFIMSFISASKFIKISFHQARVIKVFENVII